MVFVSVSHHFYLLLVLCSSTGGTWCCWYSTIRRFQLKRIPSVCGRRKRDSSSQTLSTRSPRYGCALHSTRPQPHVKSITKSLSKKEKKRIRSACCVRWIQASPRSNLWSLSGARDRRSTGMMDAFVIIQMHLCALGLFTIIWALYIIIRGKRFHCVIFY